MITESEILEAVQKELSKQYLKVAELEAENKELKKDIEKRAIECAKIRKQGAGTREQLEYEKVENEKLKTILKEARNKLADCLFKLYDENGHSYITLEQELQNILPKIDGVLK